METSALTPAGVSPQPLPSFDLAAEVAAFLRAGYSIHFVPRVSPYGVVYAEIRIIPPTPPRRIADEVQAVASGAPLSYPLRRGFHLVYDLHALAAWLRRARLLLCVSG